MRAGQVVGQQLLPQAAGEGGVQAARGGHQRAVFAVDAEDLPQGHLRGGDRDHGGDAEAGEGAEAGAGRAGACAGAVRCRDDAVPREEGDQAAGNLHLHVSQRVDVGLGEESDA